MCRGAEFRSGSGGSSTHELTRFRISFVERLYDGSPRWYASGWREYIRRVQRPWHPLDREPGVISKIRQAHDSGSLYPTDRTEFVGTCVNPDCSARVQGLFTQQVIQQLIMRGPQYNNERYRALSALARGAADDLRDNCQTCGEKAFFYPVEVIRNKWIYILKEQGSNLEHYCEIHSETSDTGTIYTELDGGKYSGRHSSPFQGYVNLLPDPTAFTWHFFLSPVRLGADALSLLQRSPQLEQNIAQARDNANPADAGVPVIAQSQPWKTTVKRNFQSAPAGRVELIPLVDPFSWAAQSVDFDFLTILAAQLKIGSDPDEQSKAFIASVLQQAMGRRQVSDSPPRWEDDEWDVMDDTVDVPSGFSGTNIAEAWTNRYRDTLEYLTEETNKACARIVFILRYSLAHRIVEQGCQDWGQEAGYLSFGLTHWAHLLREISGCNVGNYFIAWLTGPESGSSGDDPMRPAVRIPIRNVLNGNGIRDNSAVFQETGLGIITTVYAAIVPGVINRNQRPAELIVQQLGAINIQAASFQGKDLQSVRDFVLDVSSGLLDNYIERLPQGPAFSEVHRRTVAQNWSERLTMFRRLSQFDAAITLLLSLDVYTKSGRTYETGYDRYARIRDQIQTPIKIADFLAKNTRDLLKAQMSGAESRIISTLERDGAGAVAHLSAADYEIYLASRSVRAYQLLGTGVRVVAGPVGLLIGGVEMVSETMQTVDNWQAGDPGAAVGHGIQAVAGVLVIAVAGAECAALVTGAAVASWAGPVGWIAAGLMLIGALVISLWSKNDLELFARHSFLGPDYGEGDWDDETGKAWLTGHPWPWLRYDSSGRRGREASDRWQRQRLALLRMISSFKTWIGPGTFCGGYIFPTFLSNTSYLDVEIKVMRVDETSPSETFRLKVWPAARDYIWVGHRPSRRSISFSPSDGDTVTSLTISAGPETISGDRFDYDLRVRLDLDGSGQNYLPGSGAYVRNSTTLPGIYHDISSTDTD